MSAALPYDPVSLQADAPDRPPHWRWLRAQRLVDQGRELDRRRDDGWVTVAARFYRQLRQAQADPDQVDRLSERYPVLFWCHRVCFHPHRGQSRDQLEARLLARDHTLDRTAARTGLSEAQVEAYTNVFFDVRDRLDNIAWMIDCVLGQDLMKGFNPKANTGLLLRVAGWKYGTLAVDRVSGRVVDGRAADDDEALNAQVDRGEAFEVRLRSYITTRSLAVNEFTAPIIYQHANDVRKREDDRAKELSESGEKAGDVGAIRALVGALGMLQKPVTKKLMGSDDPMAAALNASAEPRAVDLFRLTSGGEGPTVTVGGVKFPEVTANDRQ